MNKYTMSSPYGVGWSQGYDWFRRVGLITLVPLILLVGRTASAEGTTLSGKNYVDHCLASGVPRPS